MGEPQVHAKTDTGNPHEIRPANFPPHAQSPTSSTPTSPEPTQYWELTWAQRWAAHSGAQACHMCGMCCPIPDSVFQKSTIIIIYYYWYYLNEKIN
jgi:hypothetical protein